ncbi:MAG: nicotinate-nucleotide adenylyltransferase [Desulfobulbaceae bacterium]|nr:nicotinate-nucleotide adenylyltransferase [Desulfobulbaceae bacterium]
MDLPRGVGQRVGVLGGTFDPVHNGHLALVEAAFAALSLDSLILIPAAVPPHKRDLRITPFAHRLAMLELAIAGRNGLFVTDIEAERPGPSFSVDTLAALRSHYGPDLTLFFLVGIDAFLDIQTWKSYRQVPQLADLVVVDRPGARVRELDAAILSRFPGYGPDTPAGCWRGANGHGVIRPLLMEPVDISSTAVRALIVRGEAVTHLLPAAVTGYIFRHHLYQK